MPEHSTNLMARKLPSYDISQYPRDNPKHADDIKEFKEEISLVTKLGMTAHYKEGFQIQGWDGPIDQRDAAIHLNQATFHPTKYVIGVLKWLQSQSNFKCYTHTRVIGFHEKGVKILGIGSKHVKMDTENGHVISCKYAVQATCVPLQKLAVSLDAQFTVSKSEHNVAE
jgi:hypothetical protein